MFTKQFWVDALERAAKTAAQFALVMFGGDAVDAWNLDWKAILGTMVAGAVTSVLTSVVSLPIGGTGTASMSHAVELSEPVGRHRANDE